MTKFGLIGAAVLSFLLATPAMAKHHHHRYNYLHALKFDYGSTNGAYGFYYSGYDFARRDTFN